MADQKALVLTAIGKPVELLTIPIPDAADLKEYEVLIQITAAGSMSTYMTTASTETQLTISSMPPRPKDPR